MLVVLSEHSQQRRPKWGICILIETWQILAAT